MCLGGLDGVDNTVETRSTIDAWLDTCDGFQLAVELLERGIDSACSSVSKGPVENLKA